MKIKRKTRGKMNMMTKYLSILALVLNTYAYAETLNDQDFDGVPDSMDKCPNTPFLNQVNANGCTTTVLRIPEEVESDNLTLTLAHGYSINEDLIGREEQYSTKLQLSYYTNNWTYSVRTGYYDYAGKNGLTDTTLKIKKRIAFSNALRLGLGVGVKLPTYDFTGNKTDVTLYTSLNYYPTTKLSFFTGFNHTLINDEQIITPLQNTNNFYLGTGYFFSNDFYANFSYAYTQSKFTDQHSSHSLGTLIYYKINKKWFTTISYSHEILDEDLHNAFNIKIGYNIW